jgi:hypothetical protein
MNPDDALKQFAQKLPDTIKDAILVRCIGPFGLFTLDPKQDYFAKFCSIIDDAPPRYRAEECAMLIGVMDLALEHSEGDAEFYSEVAKETGLKEAETMALRAPLRDRHFLAARAEFDEMRTTVLSAKALYVWQLRLKLADPIWPQEEE